MNNNKRELELTDEEIIGELRKEILDKPKQEKEPHIPEYYEKILDDMLNNKIKKYTLSEEQPQAVKYSVPKKKKRVPKSWWAWVYRAYKMITA